MEKINLVEILKDCSTGMELDCTMFDNVILSYVIEDSKYPIGIETPDGIIVLNKYGSYFNTEHAKCIIFPKGKTTWEGFVPPCKFKNGDIIYVKDKYNWSWCSIMNNCKNEELYTYVDYCIDDNRFYFGVSNSLCYYKDVMEYRLATEGEKAKLFKAIKDNGYKWNPKTKNLEELFPYKIGTKVWVKSDKEHKYIHTIVGISSNSFGNLEYEIKEEKTGTVVHYPKDLLIPVAEEKPKFKVGDKIRHKENKTWGCTIKRVTDRYYVDGHPTCFTLLFEQQNEYELVPNKFDINTLIPFESRVLVRDNDYDEWKGAFWSHLRQKADIKYDTIRGVYRQCIPYNDDTKHLLGKTNSCNDYYKIWK